MVMRQLWDLLGQLQKERALVCFHFKIALFGNFDFCVSPLSGCRTLLERSCVENARLLSVGKNCVNSFLMFSINNNPNLSTAKITKHNKTQLWKKGLRCLLTREQEHNQLPHVHAVCPGHISEDDSGTFQMECLS